MLQPRRLEDLRRAVEKAEDEPDPQLAPPQGEALVPEGDAHDDGGDDEPYGEEVRRGDGSDEAADEEERRAPHGGDADEQERREALAPMAGWHTV